MAKVVGPLISNVLARVRDPQGAAHSRSLVLSLISNMQRVVNATYEDVLEVTILSLTRNQVYYQLSDLMPEAFRVKQIFTSDLITIQEMPIAWFKSVQKDWFRATAEYPMAFALYGQDGLIIWPAPDQDNATVRVNHVKVTDALTDENDTLELPDEHVETMLQLVELVLLLRAREKEKAALKIEEIRRRLKAGL